MASKLAEIGGVFAILALAGFGVTKWRKWAKERSVYPVGFGIDGYLVDDIVVLTQGEQVEVGLFVWNGREQDVHIDISAEIRPDIGISLSGAFTIPSKQLSYISESWGQPIIVPVPDIPGTYRVYCELEIWGSVVGQGKEYWKGTLPGVIMIQ